MKEAERPMGWMEVPTLLALGSICPPEFSDDDDNGEYNDGNGYTTSPVIGVGLTKNKHGAHQRIETELMERLSDDDDDDDSDSSSDNDSDDAGIISTELNNPKSLSTELAEWLCGDPTDSPDAHSSHHYHHHQYHQYHRHRQDQQKQQEERKRVSFSTLEIREYEVTVGDHPWCRDGLAMSLDWKYNEISTVFDVNPYELVKGNRNTKAVRLNQKQRLHRLRDALAVSPDDAQNLQRKKMS